MTCPVVRKRQRQIIHASVLSDVGSFEAFR